MNIFGIAALFGAGYIYNDYRKSHKTYTPTYCIDRDGHPRTIKQYLKNVAMDKMDVIFYGGKKKHNRKSFKEGSKIAHASIPCPIVPFNTMDYAEEVLEAMKEDIQNTGNVRLANFLEYSDMQYKCNEFSFYDLFNYGWYSLDNVEVYFDDADDYYYINLPDPVYIY